MISYSTNWMGPVSIKWYKDRGLTVGICEPVTETIAHLSKNLNIGEWWEYDKIITECSCGRIDIRGLSGEEYWNGWSEYSVAPMISKDWYALSNFLVDFTSTELIPYELLIELFEKNYGRKIKWID